MELTARLALPGVLELGKGEPRKEEPVDEDVAKQIEEIRKDTQLGLTNDEKNDAINAIRARALREKADAIVQELSHFVNGEGSWDVVAEAIRSEHPTLVGQVIKGVAAGVMANTLGCEPKDVWKGERYDGEKPSPCQDPGSEGRPEHPRHDGRFSCDTIIGAELATHQLFI